MKRSTDLFGFGLVIALYVGGYSIACANDSSPLIAELRYAWQQGWSRDIVDRFDEAFRLASQDYRVHKAYENFLTANRRNQEALAAYRRSAQLAPDALEVHWATWGLLDRMEAQEEAILSLKEVVRLDPGNSLAHVRLAKALRDVDRLEESVERYAQAVALNPEQLTFRLQYARALFDVLRYNEARREVETVLARDPKDAPEAAAAQNLIGIARGDSADKGRRDNYSKHITIRGVDMAERGKRWALTREKAWQLM